MVSPTTAPDQAPASIPLKKRKVEMDDEMFFPVLALEEPPKTFALPTDAGNVNLLHQKVLTEVVSVCEELQSGSLFFPKDDYDGLYRGVCAWQRTHFMACMQIQDEVKREYKSLKEMSKTRGRKVYWKTSANFYILHFFATMRISDLQFYAFLALRA
ncbi:hypothetical protein CTEN210_03570 [Chaetoceros tenuissimus]|uniref:Uncharacterized protein n=1 Tax=Chaetoceros tenuissimus TaxID=426638 RepID=A0AAD3CL60_9STRA|nr:hypothetical protein CTEN210_03570 [Chaetoceros tenuissimus]